MQPPNHVKRGTMASHTHMETQPCQCSEYCSKKSAWRRFVKLCCKESRLRVGCSHEAAFGRCNIPGLSPTPSKILVVLQGYQGAAGRAAIVHSGLSWRSSMAPPPPKVLPPQALKGKAMQGKGKVQVHFLLARAGVETAGGAVGPGGLSLAGFPEPNRLVAADCTRLWSLVVLYTDHAEFPCPTRPEIPASSSGNCTSRTLPKTLAA